MESKQKKTHKGSPYPAIAAVEDSTASGLYQRARAQQPGAWSS